MADEPGAIEWSRPRLLRAARAAVVGGAAGIVVGSLLPWIVSGETTRNSFTSVRTARNLDLVGSDAANAVLAGWFLVPLVAATVLLLAVLSRRRSLALVAGGLGTVAALFAGFVRLAPIETAVGPLATLASAAVILLGVAGLIMAGGESRDGRRGATREGPQPMPPPRGSPVA